MRTIGRGRQTDVDGVSITWGELGDGPPLVLLHGIKDSHRTWRRAAPYLARHFRVIMPDLPGHGFSGRPDAPYTLAWYADTMSAWMAEIGVEQAHVCGHSYGGGVAQWMLLQHRHRVDRLALVSPGGLGKEVVGPLRLASMPVLGAWITPPAIRWGMRAALRLGAPWLGGMEAEERRRFVEMRRIPGSDRAFQRTLEAVINPFGQYMQTLDRADEIEEMPPMAIFWGADDPIIPPSHGEELSARAEGVALTVYPVCGHFPHLDLPQTLSDDLTAWLLDPTVEGASLPEGVVGSSAAS